MRLCAKSLAVTILIGSRAIAVSHHSTSAKNASSSILNDGVVVESVVRGRQADRAGVQTGDVMLSWSRGTSKGKLDSPFILAHVSIEEASRGLVTVHGRHGSQSRTWLLGSDKWGILARPNFRGEYSSIYEESMQLAGSGKTIESAEHLSSAVLIKSHDDIGWLAPWFEFRAALLLFHTQDWQGSDAAFDRAISLSEYAGSMVRAELLRQWASSFEYRGDLAQAAKYYDESLLEFKKDAPDSMEVSNSLLRLAELDLERSDTEQASTHLSAALFIAKRLAPTSFQIASIFEDFGILFEYRGDLGKAEEYYLRALPIEEQFIPRSRQLANTLTNLGTLAHQRGDLLRAKQYHHRALRIAEGVEENGPQIADILSNLGECVLALGDTATAERYQNRALALLEKSVPDTAAVALNLGSLGKIARIRHDFPRAEEYYARAMEIAKKAQMPEPDLARLLVGQADVWRDQGRPEKAAELYRRALAILERANPGSIDHAETLAELAGCLRRQGQLDSAAELYEKAFSTLEDRALHLGGVDDDRSRYRAWYVSYYEAYIHTLLKQGQKQRALEFLEATRARTMLEMLTRAHIDLRQGADRETLGREQSLRRLLQAKTEARLRLVTSQHTQEQLSRLDQEIEDTLMQERDVEAQLRSKSPGYAAVLEPTPLTAKEIQSLLDDDTLLLEYALGEERSLLWAVSSNSVEVYELPPKSKIEDAARNVYRVLTLRELKRSPSSELDTPQAQKQYEVASRRLSQLILQPVADLIGTKRLLIVSDGALHYIPFSALPIPHTSARLTPLIVEHEIVNLPSASVLAEIRRQREGRPRPLGIVAVFADPVFDVADVRVLHASNQAPLTPTPPAANLTRAVADIGLSVDGKLHLDRLLYSRKEAAAVISAISPGKTFEALDFNASRSAVMSGILANYRIVHFATHGLLNNKHPELSGLVLSLVDENGRKRNGFLKLQDIYDLNMPADLVVLSGCETALGEKINGEGVVGLTRGFMYAGASRVIASLWSVSDSATADLMAEFYKSLAKDRMRPASALRAAQIHMWKQTQWKLPYYWAGFQLLGDWR
jgi:CHAT domain-containing protein/Tfp pilus assembly protein PilF